MKAFVIGLGIVLTLGVIITTIEPPMIRCQVVVKDDALVKVCKLID